METAVATAYKWLPVITDYCMGCGMCVEVCPHGCLELVWEFAKLRRPGECVSGGECMDVCPQNAIRMQWVKANGSQDVGRWCETPEPAPRPPRRWFGWLFEKGAA